MFHSTSHCLDIPLIWAYQHLSVFMYDLNMIILYIICSIQHNSVGHSLKMTLSNYYILCIIS